MSDDERGKEKSSNSRMETRPPTPFEPAYRKEDDTYCWICNGPVIKRHCKIVCTVCGFMRDCSDP